MKKAVSLCLLMCGLLLFSGCSGGVPDQDTISVDKRGRVTVPSSRILTRIFMTPMNWKAK